MWERKKDWLCWCKGVFATDLCTLIVSCLHTLAKGKFPSFILSREIAKT